MLIDFLFGKKNSIFGKRLEKKYQKNLEHGKRYRFRFNKKKIEKMDNIYLQKKKKKCTTAASVKRGRMRNIGFLNRG